MFMVFPSIGLQRNNPKWMCSINERFKLAVCRIVDIKSKLPVVNVTALFGTAAITLL
jgi:hypothetical protein